MSRRRGALMGLLKRGAAASGALFLFRFEVTFLLMSLYKAILLATGNNVFYNIKEVSPGRS